MSAGRLGRTNIDTSTGIRYGVISQHSFASRADFDPYYPCVDSEQTEMHVYIGTEYHENGPDRILTIGKRGGVKVERY